MHMLIKLYGLLLALLTMILFLCLAGASYLGWDTVFGRVWSDRELFGERIFGDAFDPLVVSQLGKPYILLLLVLWVIYGVIRLLEALTGEDRAAK